MAYIVRPEDDSFFRQPPKTTQMQGTYHTYHYVEKCQKWGRQTYRTDIWLGMWHIAVGTPSSITVSYAFCHGYTHAVGHAVGDADSADV